MAQRTTTEAGAGRVTIDDVARHAGVSRAVVSRVLRDAYGVSEAMHHKVNAAIAELDYRPKLAARAMRGSTFTIGVAITTYGNQFYGEVMRGLSEGLGGTPYQLVLALADLDSGDPRRGIQSLWDRAVDGIVAIAPLAEQTWLEEVAQRVPLLQFGRHARSEAFDTVVADDVHGVRAMMEHLIGLGHRRIAHITHVDPGSDHLETTPQFIRRSVYKRVMRENGLEEEIAVIPARFEEDVSYDAVTTWLRTNQPPTAVFAGNDDAALGAIRAFTDIGIRGVSVGGFDDAAIARHPLVSLTTVNQDGRTMGRQAARSLLERIQGRTESTYLELPTELVIRGSTSPAKTKRPRLFER
jgi:LacI family transcriptional regulator